MTVFFIPAKRIPTYDWHFLCGWNENLKNVNTNNHHVDPCLEIYASVSLAAAGRTNQATQVLNELPDWYTLALKTGGRVWRWHHHLVKTQLSLNPGNGEAIPRKRAKET